MKAELICYDFPKTTVLHRHSFAVSAPAVWNNMMATSLLLSVIPSA